MIKIPLKAFEMKAEGGEVVTPEVGDMVPLEGFTGMVKSKDGENVVVDLKEYNGMPVSYEDSPEEEAKEGEPMDKEKDDLLEMMSKGPDKEE